MQISYALYADPCSQVQACRLVPSVPMGITQKVLKKLRLKRNFCRYSLTGVLPAYRAGEATGIQRLRATTTPSRNAMNKLCNGACRVTARSLAIGCPGRSAFAITSRKRSTATLSAAVTSSIPRDTSVAASIARSAMLGDGISGVSLLTLKRLPCGGGTRPPPLAIRARACFSNSGSQATFGYPRQAPL